MWSNIRVSMQFTKALDPHTGVTPILLVLNAHAVPAGAAIAQLPSHGLAVVEGVLIHKWGEGR